MLTPLRKTSIIAPALKACKSYFSFHSSGRIESKKKTQKNCCICSGWSLWLLSIYLFEIDHDYKIKM